MRLQGWIPLVLVALCVAVYSRVYTYEFVGFDDFIVVVQNPHLRAGFGLEGLRAALLPYASNWIPLTTLSLQIDYALFGLNPGAFHITNLVLHSLSSVVLFLALQRMTRATWRSAFVAAVFAVHPLHVESVAWISERKDTLAGLFWMLCLLAYARQQEQPKSLARRSLSLLMLALGLLSKPSVVTMPFVLLLLDYWPLARLRTPQASRLPDLRALRGALIEKGPMFGLVAAASVATYLAQQAGGSIADVRLHFGLRFANAIESYVIYLWKSLVPTHLGHFYPHPDESIAISGVVFSALLLFAATWFFARMAATRPYAIVGWLWFLGTLVPMIGLVQVGAQARADRYMYLPIIGLSILVAWGAVDLAERWRIGPRVLASAAVGSLALLAAAAFVQVGTWQNTEVLYRRALAVTEANYVVHKELGNELLKQKRLDEAEQSFAEALRLAPDWSLARLGLADVALARGRLSIALGMYNQELQRDPDNDGAAGRYGLALGLVGRFAEARDYAVRGLRVSPGSAELHRALADIEGALGNSAESVRYGREALRLMPGNVGAANNLAWTLATTRDKNVRNPQEAIRLIAPIAEGSSDPELLDTLAVAYAADGRFDRAAVIAERALSLVSSADQMTIGAEIRARLALFRAGRDYQE
jgi:tetratricopeptide (TPR) repeat protein